MAPSICANSTSRDGKFPDLRKLFRCQHSPFYDPNPDIQLGFFAYCSRVRTFAMPTASSMRQRNGDRDP